MPTSDEKSATRQNQVGAYQRRYLAYGSSSCNFEEGKRGGGVTMENTRESKPLKPFFYLSSDAVVTVLLAMAPNHQLLRRLHRQRAGPPALRAGPRGSEGGDVPRPGEGLQRSSADLLLAIRVRARPGQRGVGLCRPPQVTTPKHTYRFS